MTGTKLLKKFSSIAFLALLINITCEVNAQNICESAQGVTPPITLEKVVKGFDTPLQVTNAKDNSKRLFVVNKMGTIQVVQDGKILPEPFLNLANNLATDNEQGLLSIAFHPNYAENGRLFVFYTRQSPFASVISEFQVNATEVNLALAEETVILEIPQAEASTMHRAGQLQFGTDGYLYAALGDAGYSNLAQKLDNLNGKIIRIDVDKTSPYSIPKDNPFTTTTITATPAENLLIENVKPEIWAYGFRNPWRFSFDRCNGNLFTGDVGSTRYEEINLVEKGGNYGWTILEASRCRDNQLGYKCGADRFKPPIHEYAHFHIDPEGGLAVVGGYVYRGKVYPSLQGRYFFADMTGKIWSLTATENIDGAGKYSYWQLDKVWQGYGSIVSFGEDDDGEMYVVNLSDKTLYQMKVRALNLAEADLIATTLPQSIALEGWGEAEKSGRWSFGKSSTLTFYLEEPQKMALDINFLNPFPNQTVTIKLNNQEIAEFKDLAKNKTLKETLYLTTQQGTNRLSFHYRDWNNYLTTLENEDPRPLALKFQVLRLSKVFP